MILFTVILMDLLAGMEFDLFVPSFPAQYSNLNIQVRIDGWQTIKTMKDLEHLVWGF